MSKYILGVNGWIDRNHDASACIVRDGELIVMAEEERFIRDKHAYDKVPYNAIRWCLDEVGIEINDISTIAIGWDYELLYEGANRIDEYNKINLLDTYLPKHLYKYDVEPEIKLVPHHLAHAASAYYLSGMDEASILVVDGQGENESTTFAVCRGNNIEILSTLPVKDSLGYFYEAVSEYIGLGSGSVGKTMGLAPYGKVESDIDNIITGNNNCYEVQLGSIERQSGLDMQEEVSSAWKTVLYNNFGNIREQTYSFAALNGRFLSDGILENSHKNIAASAQKALENTLQHCINTLINETGISNLCYAGGVALNCTNNGKIRKNTKVSRVFIPPFANDAGVSAGAALYVGRQRSKAEFSSALLGPSFTNDEIKSVLMDLSISNFRKSPSIEKEVASLLANNKTVAWFQGNMEVGPRALGNRSILANPKNKQMHEVVNHAKSREQWRPLSPSVLEEHYTDYFDLEDKSPFMLFAAQVKDGRKKEIPAVVHVDGSARPQTVSKGTNPRYHKLIREFQKITGTPVILNTSFNGAGEPIVCTPRDAIRSFYSNTVEYLAIGDFLIEK